MRKKRAFNSIAKTIKRYEQDVTIISKSKTLDESSGRFTINRTEKVRPMAIFKKSSKYVLRRDKGEIIADIKIYSYCELIEGSEIVVKNKSYKIVDTEEREETSPIVFIAYAKEIDEE